MSCTELVVLQYGTAEAETCIQFCNSTGAGKDKQQLYMYQNPIDHLYETSYVLKSL